jgi:exosome complex component RRP45
VVPPFPDRPAEGFLQFVAEFTPMAAPLYSSGRVSDDEILLNRMLEKVLRGSRALDTEGLCIVAGKMVWSIRVDVHVLDMDGNLTDAASIAAITALLHFRRPDVTVIGEEVTVVRSVLVVSLNLIMVMW